MDQQNAPLTHVDPHRGFTLIELMISIALVVILILGVSQVFQYTTQAVGAGEAITSAIRNGRSVQTAFDADFGAMVGYGTGVNDSACMILSARSVYAFRDAKDQSSQGTLSTAMSPAASAVGLPPAAFRDLNGDGISGDPAVNGEIVFPDNYNYRNHRLDTISFFARNQFARQTGNLGSYVDQMSLPEAWIWYGHLWLPDNNGAYPFTTYAAPTVYPVGLTGPLTFPGAGNKSTNPNNYYASQFVLGRQAILLAQKNSLGTVTDNNGVAQRYFNFVTPTAGNYPANLDPLCSSSQAATVSGDTASWYLQDSRLDLAATSISAFRSIYTSYLDPNNASVAAALPYWCDWMMDGSINPPTTRAFPANAYTRFKCNPYLTKPMTAVNMAQASSYLMGGCSQFIVEFAGDFLTQDNNPNDTTRIVGTHTKYGDVIGTAISAVAPIHLTNVQPDGQLDFFINANGVKQTIWYGMPRNTSGQTTTRAYDPAALQLNNTLPNNPNGDVVPLRDWLQYVFDTTGHVVGPGTVDPHTESNASFEQYYPPYADAGDYNAYFTMAHAQNGYTCAWGPTDPHPKIMLIRITMTVEDPTGRLPDGQTFQYVFPVTPTPSSN